MNKKQKQVAVGVSVGALAAAAAAGTYFFAGKRGAKNRAKVSKWMEVAKKDVSKQLKNAKHLTQQSYSDAVDKVVGKYKQLKKAGPAELLALASELKGQWNVISKDVTKAVRKVVPGAKKKAAVKKTPTKKISKKRQ